MKCSCQAKRSLYHKIQLHFIHTAKNTGIISETRLHSCGSKLSGSAPASNCRRSPVQSNPLLLQYRQNISPIGIINSKQITKTYLSERFLQQTTLVKSNNPTFLSFFFISLHFLHELFIPSFLFPTILNLKEHDE